MTSPFPSFNLELKRKPKRERKEQVREKQNETQSNANTNAKTKMKSPAHNQYLAETLSLQEKKREKNRKGTKRRADRYLWSVMMFCDFTKEKKILMKRRRKKWKTFLLWARRTVRGRERSAEYCCQVAG
jgi:hypothetical protein